MNQLGSRKAVMFETCSETSGGLNSPVPRRKLLSPDGVKLVIREKFAKRKECKHLISKETERSEEGHSQGRLYKKKGCDSLEGRRCITLFGERNPALVRERSKGRRGGSYDGGQNNREGGGFWEPRGNVCTEGEGGRKKSRLAAFPCHFRDIPE